MVTALALAVATGALRSARAVRSSVVCDWFLRFHGDLVARHGEEGAVAERLRDHPRRAAPARERDLTTA